MFFDFIPFFIIYNKKISKWINQNKVKIYSIKIKMIFKIITIIVILVILFIKVIYQKIH